MERKTEYLARVADTLQAEINVVQEQARLSEKVADLTDTQFRQLRDQVNSTRKVNEEMSAVNETMLMAIDRNHHDIVALQSLKQELDDFKDAAGPVLRSARIDEVARIKLSYACNLR